MRSTLVIAPQLTMETTASDEVTRLSVGGELDAWSCDALMDAVERASVLSDRRLTIDLCDLSFVDSSGIRALLWLRDELGQRLALGRLSPPAHRILERTGLLTKFARDPAI
jgi:anti-anti-sigma factor